MYTLRCTGFIYFLLEKCNTQLHRGKGRGHCNEIGYNNFRHFRKTDDNAYENQVSEEKKNLLSQE